MVEEQLETVTYSSEDKAKSQGRSRGSVNLVKGKYFLELVGTC